MRWFEYKTEVDALHAPDDLKARLHAMKTQQDTLAAADGRQGAGAAKKPARKKAVACPLQRLAGQAASEVWGAGVMLAVVAVPQMKFFRMGSSSSSMAMTATGGTSPGAAADLSAAQEYANKESAMDSNVSADTALGAQGLQAGADPAETKARDTARKIIYTANLTLEATDYDATLAALQQALAAAGGYVQSSESYNYGTNDRIVNYTLRVPAENYQSFLAGAEGAGNLVEKSEDSDDITAAYVDVAARIDSLAAQRTRLLELEARAESLTDLLEIENQLTQVQYQLESYQRQMAVYDDQVDYCTVKLAVYEVAIYTPVQPTTSQRLWNALTGGLARFGDAMFDFVLWLLSVLPWLVLLAVLFGAAWAVRRKRRNSRT